MMTFNMDFRNLCQKIDVDIIRAKITALPTMPALPQLKLPKSMPKLKSRKIFRSSREDVNRASTKNQQQQEYSMQQHASMQQMQLPIPPADFIDHTPTRISTISSLMHQSSQEHQHQFGGGGRGSTYRSACSINDDDYPSPTQYDRHRRGGGGYDSNRSDISPVRTFKHSQPRVNSPLSGSNANVKMSLSEKLQKGYKDISEFKFKHIFAKKTVVRKDNIEVDHYVIRYDEDRMREQQEQERRDRQIADNYDFKFKLSRQNTGHSESVSPSDSPIFGEKGARKTSTAHKVGKSVGEQSGDESGMEASPPKRNQSSAATTRFEARRQMSEESNQNEESEFEYVEEVSRPQPVARFEAKESRKKEVKSTGYRQRIRRLTTYVSSHDESGAESNAEACGSRGSTKVLSKLRSLGRRTPDEGAGEIVGGTKRKAPLTPQQSNEKAEEQATDKPVNAFKHNFKRLQKSMKRQPSATVGANVEDSEDEDTPRKETKPPVTKTEKLTARLRRFKSREASIDNLENVESGTPKKDESKKSPIRTVLSNKLQTWKKSFKKQPTEAGTRTDDEEEDQQNSPESRPQKRTDTLLNKLKYIRSRKQPNSTEDLDAPTDDEGANVAKSKDGASRKPTNLEEKFEQARQRTMKKVNEKMQQIKFFHKSQEHIEKEQVATKNKNKRIRNSSDEDDAEEEQEHDKPELVNVPPTIPRRGVIHNQEEVHSYNSEQDDIEEITNIQHEYATHRTRWTTNPLLNESMESDTDSEYPRVLIHQDNSDLFESTLIIAVTRPTAASPSPKITEIHSEHDTPIQKAKPVEWVSNKDIISGFLEVTPPSKRKETVDAIVVTAASTTRGHARKLSMDSNNSDSDSWIPESVRNKQLAPSQESSRRASTAGLISIEENEEPWKVHSMFHEEKLYKAKSIDIFEASAIKGGATTAFEDFDDELKNEPVVKIVGRHQNVDSFEKDSSEDAEAPDDDSSSRITKILVDSIKEEDEEVPTRMTISRETKDTETRLYEDNTLRQIGNSRESLDANFDENEEMDSDDDDEDDANDRPPSVSPPPPPLPQRQPSIRVTKPQTVVEATLPMTKSPSVTIPMTVLHMGTPPPPLPTTKPPLPPHKPLLPPPPKIPDRTASMTRIAKPLVKTSSLRLAYNEQVKPSDVGKVNKLISRFEQPNSKATERPRLIPRQPVRNDSEDYSDDEEDEDEEEKEEEEESDDDDDVAVYEKDYRNAHFQMERDITPTNQPPILKTVFIESSKVDNKTIKVVPAKRMPAPAVPTATISAPVISNTTTKETLSSYATITSTRHDDSHIHIQRSSSNLKSPINIPIIALNLDNNSNYSRPSSEYGSPLEYPSSLKGSTETTPVPDRRPQQQLEMRRTERSRRSMTRDNENFYSFDSDEENSYYSISPSGSSRYVVEI